MKRVGRLRTTRRLRRAAADEEKPDGRDRGGYAADCGFEIRKQYYMADPNCTERSVHVTKGEKPQALECTLVAGQPDGVVTLTH